MNAKLKKSLRYVLSIALAGGLIWYTCSKVDWSSFSGNMASCRWGYILLAMGIGVCAALLRGLRWRCLLLPLVPGLKRRIPVLGFCMAYLANMTIPYSGELLRCGYVSSETGAPFDKTLGTLALERVWDLFTLIALLLTALALGAGQFGEFLTSWVSDSVHGSLPLFIAGFFALLAAFVFAISRLRRAPGAIGRLCTKADDFLRGLWSGFTTCLRMPHKGLFLLYTLLIWSTYWMQSWCTIQALQGAFSGFSLVDALCLSLIGSLAAVLPAPGGFGTYHALVQFALSTVCFQGLMGMGTVEADSLGMTYAVLAHEPQAVVQILLGVSALIILAIRRRKTNPTKP